MGFEEEGAETTEAAKREADLAIVFATLTLAWNLYGFAGNFFGHYWPRCVAPVSYLGNVLLLTALSGVAISRNRRPSLLALAAALIVAWSLIGTFFEVGVAAGLVERGVARPPLNFRQPPP
ncbi:MAG: hypothetical protein M3198_05730, partial [Actinomycetota bacterium]|nr:hypothetical protein [Actinomycetota bacterium]